MIINRCSHFVIAVFLVLMAGCASTFKTQVSTFRDERATLGQGTIKVVPQQSEQEGQTADSLEFGYYRNRLEQKLATLGYTPVAEHARYLARLGYRVEQREVPDKGPRTSIGTSIGTFGGHVGIGTGITLSGGDKTDTEYFRTLTIVIQENTPRGSERQADHLVEIRATSAGSCGKLTLAFDQMLDAIFTNFMRPSGSTETVEIRADKHC